MSTYEPMAGTHIDTACKRAVEIAAGLNESVDFKFNDVALRALPTDDPVVLVNRWQSIMDANRAAYGQSSEGIEAMRRRKADISRKQQELEAALEALPKILRTDNHLNALVKWLDRFIECADDVAVTWDSSSVVRQLKSAGYLANEHAGQQPEWFNTRKRMGRYLIGQAISCMERGLPPHPITRSFAKKYFDLASESSPRNPAETGAAIDPLVSQK